MKSLPEPINKIDGIYYLIEYLSYLDHGATIDGIVSELERSEKTIRRYLEYIDNIIIGVDLIKERGPDRKYRYRIEKQAAPFRPLVFNSYEVMSLFFIRGFAHFKDINFIQENLLNVFSKFKLSAKETSLRTGNNFQERISNLFILPRELGGKVYNDNKKPEILELIIKSALEHKQCEITYGSGKDIKRFTIAPLHMFNYRDALYLMSINIKLSKYRKKTKLINMALHRINDIKVLDDTFKYPDDLDVDKHFKSKSFNFEDDIHDIVLKFSSEIQNYILDREWYPNQKVKTESNGSTILKFKSDLNLILLGWIRGFGSYVEVLEPMDLRESIIKDLKNNLKQY